MIEIKPTFSCKFTCPECSSSSITVKEIVFPGIRVLADCVCDQCKFEFLNDLPVGHALYYPMKLGKKNLKVYDAFDFKWFAKPLVNSYKNQLTEKIKIDEKIITAQDEVIILNCLDYLYGHVLLKLFNVQFYLERFPDKGVIVLAPKSFEWLIPDGVAETWLVDEKIKNLQNWMTELDTFVKEKIKHYKRVYLSPVYSHPELNKIDISIFTKVKPFDINLFSQKNATVTFVYREDRLWHSNAFEYFIFRAFRKFKLLNYTRWYFLTIQNLKISRLLKTLKKKFPDAKLNVVGMGKFGSFPEFVTDLRSTSISVQTEKKWCEAYSESHLVVGIHGSNMLIPTALAAGFLEILPSDRIGNITQDVFAKYNDRQMLFLGRFLHEYVSSKEVGMHAIKILSGFKNYELYTKESFLKYEVLNNIQISDLKIK